MGTYFNCPSCGQRLSNTGLCSNCGGKYGEEFLCQLKEMQSWQIDNLAECTTKELIKGLTESGVTGKLQRLELIIPQDLLRIIEMTLEQENGTRTTIRIEIINSVIPMGPDDDDPILESFVEKNDLEESEELGWGDIIYDVPACILWHELFCSGRKAVEQSGILSFNESSTISIGESSNEYEGKAEGKSSPFEGSIKSILNEILFSDEEMKEFAALCYDSDVKQKWLTGLVKPKLNTNKIRNDTTLNNSTDLTPTPETLECISQIEKALAEGREPSFMYFIKIGENPAIEALPMLVKTAEKTSDAYVAEALARTLGQYKQPEAGEALLHLLSFKSKLDPYRKVRSMALYGFELRASPDPHEVEEIAARLGETTLNGWAANALASIGTEQAITMLITALEKQSRDLMIGSVERIQIVNALAKTHNPAALAPLVELLARAPEWEIKDIAKALKIITGQSFGTDVTKWKAWIAR